MAKLLTLSATRPADPGELLVINHLERELPGTYTLIPNVEIVEPGRPALEYDLVVIAPHAVYAIEIKRWRGGIQGDDFTWVIAGQHRRQNPWPTINNKARVLKSQIQRREPTCDRMWVEPLVVIADDQSELQLRGNCRDKTVRYTDLPDLLRNAAALGDKANDLRAVRGYIERAVQVVARGRSARALHFGDYEVQETLSQRDTVAEYLARNVLLRGGEPVRLRVFSYDPYLPPDDQIRRQEIIRREAEALQRIGPHPNLITLRSFDTDRDDPNLFVEVTDWSDAGTLRMLMRPETPLSLERKLELIEGVARGLKAAHEANVIHRDVRPENVLIGRDQQPRLMNFDHARLTLTGTRTISPIQYDPDVPRGYIAPELMYPLNPPTPATDLYGLGTILFEMLTGSTLYDSPEDAQRNNTSAGGPLAFDVVDVPVRLNELVRRMTSPAPERRPQTVDEVLSELQAIREKPSGTQVDEGSAPVPVPPPVEVEPYEFPPGYAIDGKYIVEQIMPPGASGRVYKVFDPIISQVFALKVINNTALSLQLIKQEAQSVFNLVHPNIVRVHGWGRLAQSNRFYLVSEFVQGEELTTYTTGAKRMPMREAVACILQLLSALETLHPDVERIEELRAKKDADGIELEEYDEFQRLQSEGWLHRDIKPPNLIWSKDGLKLIDFNIAGRVSEVSHTVAGTPGYMPPDIGLLPWDTGCDLFAVGIVLYELITGHHPYPDRTPNVEDLPTDPRDYVPELIPAFAELLLKAVSVVRNVRYRSTRRFRQDLLDLDGLYLQAAPTVSLINLDLALDERGKLNYNPYVTRLKTLYSQARRNNSGTRGFDDIAKLTYVDTRLDLLLRPAVLDGQYRLVIITGNAGDGKTAFIKKLEDHVKEQGSLIEQPTPNSSVFNYHSVRFIANYDGSQDEGADRANDQVLAEFFAAFSDDALDREPTQLSVHLIAINEGRLIDFFDQTPREQVSPFQKLGRLINNFFESDNNDIRLPDWMLIVDLNQRSVVASEGSSSETSIFVRQLRALLKPEFWAPCEACALRDRCFIKFNADTLADPASGPAVIERLRTLFEIIHLRRRLHITMRDMRSALSWLIVRDHSCEDVAQFLQTHPAPDDQFRLLYHSAFAFDDELPEGRNDDRLVRLLRQIDPAQVANPVDDRRLHFQGLTGLPMMVFEQRSPLDAAWTRETESALNNEPVRLAERHALLRRIAFFERRDDDWIKMLPYRNLDLFRQHTQQLQGNEELPKQLKQTLVQGISFAEGARNPELAQQYIWLRTGTVARPTIKAFRLFPAVDFKVRVPGARGGRYVEHTPDRIVLYHDPQDARQRLTHARPAELNISLDLFELLTQMQAGFTPSPGDVGGYFVNLVIFKNVLAHLPYRQVLLTRDDRQFYKMELDDNMVVTLMLGGIG